MEDFAAEAEERIDRTRFRYTLRARCRNLGGPLSGAAIRVRSRAPETEVLEGQLRCGPLGAGASEPTLDTVTVIHDRSVPFDPAALEWVAVSTDPSRFVEMRVDGDRFEHAFGVDFTNPGGLPVTLRAFLTSTRDGVDVLQSQAEAAVPPGTALRSGDVFRVAHDRSVRFEPGDLDFLLQIVEGGDFGVALTSTGDELGHPLGAVDVEETSPSGVRSLASDSESGAVSLGGGSGAHTWKFSRAGRVPVWRRAELGAGVFQTLPAPRLALRAESKPLSLLSESTLQDAGESVRLVFPPTAFASAGEASLTVLDAQTLPSLLPRGWSPLAAFWLELPGEPRAPAAATLTLWDRLATSEGAVLARFDPQQHVWRAEQIVSGDGGAVLPVSIPKAGAWLVAVPDAGDGAPPLPPQGGILEAGALVARLLSGATGSGVLEPALGTASSDPRTLIARARVDLAGEDPLPSGALLRTEVEEEYVLRDGSRRRPLAYTASLVAYQRPGDGDARTLHLHFATRPRLALGPDLLREARVTTRVLPEEGISATVLTPEGGRVVAPGVEIAAPAGALADVRAASLRSIDPAALGAVPDVEDPIVQAFELDVSGVLAGRELLASFGRQAANAHFVLARIVSAEPGAGLEPVARWRSDASGDLVSVEPQDGVRLPGISRPGTYALLRVASSQGLVAGVVRDEAGAAAPAATLRFDGLPWVARSGADGALLLIAPDGEWSLRARTTGGDEGQILVTVLVTGPGSVTTVALSTRPTGPRVVETTPADGARGVAPVTPVEIVFSEPIAASTLGAGAVTLRDASGQTVAGSLALDLRGTTATLLPYEPLESGTVYTLALGGAITDLTGLPLEGPRSVSFTVSRVSARLGGAQLVSWAPGSDASDCTNFPDAVPGAPPVECNCSEVPGFFAGDPSISCLLGTQGAADPEVPVILVNETTGATATVLSRADGSFRSFVQAGVEDALAAVFVNANGTRVRLPLGRQLFDDGTVALFPGGGVLEAESDGGPVQVLVEPGAIPDKARFRLEPVPTETLRSVVEASPPAQGRIVGSGVRIELEADALEESPDISIPVDPATLSLPAGLTPEEGVYGLVAVVPLRSGGHGYLLLDKMEYEDGRLVTRSFPFLSLLLFVGGLAIPEVDMLGLVGPGGGQFLLFNVLLVPVVLPFIERVTVSGNVLNGAATPLSPTPLAGALVTIRTGGGFVRRPGQLTAGEMFTASDAQGRYAIMVDRAPGYSLVATHALFPFSEATTSVTQFVGVPTQRADLLFGDAESLANGSGDATPPQVAASHSPIYPAPGQPATLSILSSDVGGPPTVAVEIALVLPLSGGAPDPTAVELGPPIGEPVGFGAVRTRVDVQATSPVRAILEVTATDPSGNSRKIEHVMDFGGSAPTGSGPIPAPDPDDEIPPRVTFTSPGSGATAFALDEPIRLRFSEPIDPGILADPGAALSLGGAGGVPTVELSDDQGELRVRFPSLVPDQDYTLTLGAGVQDLAGNALDQDPTTDATDAFVLSFRTASFRSAPLPGMESGAGVVLRGRYAFALEQRGAHGGSIVVFDLADPAAPERIAERSLLPFPRDLVLVPDWSFVRNPNQPVVETRDLLVVVGGDINPNQNLGQYITVLDVSDPPNPKRITGTQLTFSNSAAATRVVWSPPVLAYALADSAITTIGLVDLQAFLIANLVSEEEYLAFPPDGRPGSDANEDGDYVDEDDELPLPARAGLGGKLADYPVGSSTRRLRDLAIDWSGEYVGAVVSSGPELDPITGGPLLDPGSGEPIYRPAAFRTVSKGEVFVPPGAGEVSFGADLVKRLFVQLGTAIEIDGALDLRDLALVSVASPVTGASRIVVIDVTDPFAPVILNEIPVPLALGSLQSIVRRDDGGLLAATATSALVLDPAKLARPPAETEGALAPAVVATLPKAGGNSPTFAGSTAGLQVVSAGGRNLVLQSAPRLAFVSFLGDSLVDPEALVDEIPQIEDVLERLRVPSALPPAWVTAEGEVPSDLDPPAPAAHHHVLVYAPGGAGATIELSLESLDAGGRPLRAGGAWFPPVRAVGEATASALGEASDPALDAPVQSLRAFRLSSDPTSPHYDLYLSHPFALVVEGMPLADLEAFRATPKREILWSGARTRASLDPAMASNPVLGPFVASVDAVAGELRPGVAVESESCDLGYDMGPNPPPAAGLAPIPGVEDLVAAHNGELRVHSVDLELPGRRLPIRFERRIAGQALHQGPFGRGWQLGWDQRVTLLGPDRMICGDALPLVVRETAETSEIARSGDLLFHDAEGRIWLHPRAADGVPPEIANDPLVASLGWLEPGKADAWFLPPRGRFDVFVRFRSGQLARLEPDGTQSWFDASGRLEKIVDRHPANRIELRRSARGELLQVRDELDRAIDVGWYRAPGDAGFRPGIDVEAAGEHEKDRIARLLDYAGRDVLYRYDARGRLERVEGVEITQAEEGGFLGRQRIEYAYAGSSQVASSAEGILGATTGLAIPGAGSQGTPAVRIQGFAPDARDRVQQLRLGTRLFSIASSHPNQSAAVAGGSTTLGEPGGGSVEVTLDEEGRPASVLRLGADAGPIETSYAYDDAGLLRRVVHPEGNSVEIERDLGHASLRSRGNVIEIRLDPGPRPGEPLSASYAYDPRSNLPSGEQRDFAGHSTVVALDAAGRDAVSRSYSTGEQDEWEYNAFGQLLQETSADGVTRGFTYQPGTGFPASRFEGEYGSTYAYTGEAGTRGLPASETDAGGTATKFTWNENGQLVRSEREGFVERLGYDELGRPTAVATSVDAGDLLRRTLTYDSDGFLRIETVQQVEVDGSPQDLVTTRTPDANLQVASVTLPDGTVVDFDHDAAGRVRSATHGGYTETYTHDRNGNLRTIERGDATEEFLQDGHDRLRVHRGPDGSTLTIERNGNGHPLRQIHEDPVFGVLRDAQTPRDGRDRPTALTLQGAGATETRSYTYPSPGTVVETDAAGESRVRSIDASGRVKEEKDSVGTQSFSYDARGNPATMISEEDGRLYSEITGHDALGRLHAESDALGPVATWTRRLDGAPLGRTDALGHETQMLPTRLGEEGRSVRANGVVLEHHYDANRRLVRHSDVLGNDRRYEHGARLVIESIEHPDGTKAIFGAFDGRNRPQTASQAGVFQLQTSYDLLGRVVGLASSKLGADRAETFAWDALERVRGSEHPGGSMARAYDARGLPTSNVSEGAGGTATVTWTHDAAGRRSALSYPGSPALVTAETRDPAGRLLSLAAGGPLVSETQYAGREQVASHVLGANLLRRTDEWDARRRLVARRYERLSDGVRISDQRYAHDAADRIVARQFVERAGRADLFAYDPGDRLIRADVGARVRAGSDAPRVFAEFAPAPEVPGDFAPGLFARRYAHAATDALVSVETVDPDALDPPPFASDHAAVDPFLHVSTLDGFARPRDGLGNTERVRLAIGASTGTATTLVPASLVHDARSQLVRIERDDGAVIENQYDGEGLRLRRRVTCPVPPPPAGCTASDRRFVYDGPRLLEEWDVTNGSELLARYFYADGYDALVAADLRDAGGALRRHFVVTDVVGSVLAIADETGRVVERVSYDPYGMARFEARDEAPPRVRRLVSDGAGFAIEFSERVVPPLGPGGADIGLVTGAEEPGLRMTVRRGGEPVPGTFRYEERSPGFSFGTVVRFTAAPGALTGALELVLEGGAVVDEWSQASVEETLPFSFVPAPGAVLVATGAATAPAASARSRHGLSLLFHGQVYDADTGLYYLRARFYDPASGLFLERDPEEYVDGPNHYAAFAHDPVSLRDPTGRNVVRRAMSWLARKLKRGGGPAAGTEGLGVSRWKETAGGPEWRRPGARSGADGTTRWSVGRGAKMPTEVGGVTRWSVAPTRATGGGRAQAALDALRRRDALGYFKKEAEVLDVSTRRNGAVFWSGRRGDVSNQVPARAFAEANDRKILEMTPGGKWLDDLRLFEPGSPLSGQHALEAFETMSRRFAGKASGNAVGFVHGMREKSVFNRIELPALGRNPRVTNLITEFLE